MSEKRYAVLIASSEYQDPKLQNLRLPENDVEGINEILSSEKHGNFSETFVLKNRPSNEVLRTINQVLKRAGKDDLVLIYFSGHGKLNRAGKLHLATTDTEIELLEATSIPLDTIRNYIDIATSNKVALILDSCFSGAAGAAFTKGEVEDQLHLASGGRGTYLMTSATGIQTALEKEGDRYGVFTKHIIEGIKSGEADRDDDTHITMDELYSYVRDHVMEESHQQPMKWNLNVRGEMVIARSGKSKSEERAKEIRKMLLEQVDKGILPKTILSKSLDIVSTKPSQRSNADMKYDHLLDQLHKKNLEIGGFIEEWYKIELEDLKQPKEKLKSEEQPRKYASSNLVAQSKQRSKKDSEWLNKGNALFSLKKYDEAIRAYDTVIQLNPQNSDAWYNKGVVLEKKFARDEAIRAYSKAIELNPQHADAGTTKVLFFRVRVCMTKPSRLIQMQSKMI